MFGKLLAETRVFSILRKFDLIEIPGVKKGKTMNFENYGFKKVTVVKTITRVCVFIFQPFFLAKKVKNTTANTEDFFFKKKGLE